jgi:hypothetical protein
MSINWQAVGVAGTVIAGVAALHGLTSRKWRDAHTLGVILGLAASLAPKLLQ